MSTAREHALNAAAKLDFWLPVTDPLSSPPGRPLAPVVEVPAWVKAANDAAREVDGPDPDDEVVYYHRSRYPSGGAA